MSQKKWQKEEIKLFYNGDHRVTNVKKEDHKCDDPMKKNAEVK